MSGRIAAKTIEALKLLINAGMTPYAAAHRAGINLSTMYRCPIYRRYRDSGGNPAVLAELRKELDVTRPEPRKAKKAQRFMA